MDKYADKSIAHGGYSITEGKGFHIVFPNGIVFSTQIGRSSFCSRRHPDDPYFSSFERNESNKQSPDAEIAIWDAGGNWVTREMYKEIFPAEEYPDDILGYVNIEDWLKIFAWCKNWHKGL